MEKPMSKKMPLASIRVNLSKSINTPREAISSEIHTP